MKIWNIDKNLAFEVFTENDLIYLKPIKIKSSNMNLSGLMCKSLNLFKLFQIEQKKIFLRIQQKKFTKKLKWKFKIVRFRFYISLKAIPNISYHSKK